MADILAAGAPVRALVESWAHYVREINGDARLIKKIDELRDALDALEDAEKTERDLQTYIDELRADKARMVRVIRSLLDAEPGTKRHDSARDWAQSEVALYGEENK